MAPPTTPEADDQHCPAVWLWNGAGGGIDRPPHLRSMARNSDAAVSLRALRIVS
jgi:hypothetical protein